VPEPTNVATRIRTRLVAGDPELRGAGPFRSLWYANALSLTAGEGYEITLLLLASAAYGHVLGVGWLGMAFTLPAIVVSPLVGAWLDRARAARGRAMRAADLARAVLATSMALALIHAPGAALPIYLGAAAITAFDVVFSTALRASLPGLLRGHGAAGPRRLTAANAMLTAQTTTAQIVAPPLFVFALQYLSPVTVVLLNAATYLASYVLLRRYAAAVTASVPAARSGDRGGEPGYLTLLRDGFSAVRRDDVAPAVLIAYALTAGIGFAMLLSVPRLVLDRGLPALTVGLSFSVLAGGALFGTRLARRHFVATRPVPILVADPLARAAVVLMLATTANAATVVAGFLVIGVSAGMANVSRATLIQLRFDDATQGRAMSLYLLANQILMPVTPVLWTAAAAAYGITASYVAVAGVFVTASLVLVSGRGVRREMRRP
jgi:Major Facilitator Superfamily